ncbi:hypothetical protein [Peribacillus sp. NPDC096540]|uniref:hypothetical protein n=1 Tax=Peribacillus sp. NPDC096540 TaxID=3390612 RepID=UPI003D04DAB6
MTQYIYIASPMKLPEGSFGLKPVSPEQPNVFKDELDFTHLHFEDNYDRASKTRFSYSSHFSFNHQVAINHNLLPLKYVSKSNAIQEKCLDILYSYIEEELHASGVIEYFTSLNGHEDLPIGVNRSVSWTDIKTPYDLVIADREFWYFTL